MAGEIEIGSFDYRKFCLTKVNYRARSFLGVDIVVKFGLRID